ncbi:PH domain-containing protein [Micromonospora sp. NIE79]|uniref:PH domain-containing protein n=1 Tax=Micromonospora trifolii TaxID=2911208 RepID=A0ABS9N1H9_9ACTN|nr:PH domain-containing protein [Micromonospora trifolii]MCG5443808.1 PH domain-containing protein [Micromonospora trifolii]
MRRWQRMDPWGVGQVLTGFMFATGSVLTVTTVVFAGRALIRGEVDVRTALGMAGGLTVMGVWLTLVLRMHLAGIYVNDRGVRLRHLFSTRTLPWSQVTRFEARPALFLGGPTSRLACWVRTTDGAFESAVQRRSRSGGWRKNNGPVLAVADFDQLLVRLAEQHAARGRAGGRLDSRGAASR